MFAASCIYARENKSYNYYLQAHLFDEQSASCTGDVNMHCKKSVDFTVKYGNLAATSFTVIFTGVYL